jgi:hypothetical protein
VSGVPDKGRKKKAVVRKPSKAPAPKKKPPKAKKKPPKAKPRNLPAKVGKAGRPSSTEVVMPEEAHPAWIRKQAQIHYYTDLVKRCTVKQMYESGLFPGVSLARLRAWATEDHWVELRKRYEAQYQHAMERQRGATLARERAKEMEKAQKQLDKMDRLLNGKKAPPAKTYEGMITARVRLAGHIEQLRDVQLDQTLLLEPPPHPGAEGGAGPEVGRNKVDLSAEEAREAARAILKVRRERIREEMGIVDEEADKSLLEK